MHGTVATTLANLTCHINIVFVVISLCMCVCVYLSHVGQNKLPKVMLFSEMMKRPVLFSRGHTLVLCRGVIAFSLSTSLKRGLGKFTVLIHMRPKGIIDCT